jgi:hypothetical protein
MRTMTSALLIAGAIVSDARDPVPVVPDVRA